MLHTSFATIIRGLDRDLPPMCLYAKAPCVLLEEINRMAKEIEEA